MPVFAVEDLPLDRTGTLVPALAAKDLPLAEHSYDDDYIYPGFMRKLDFNTTPVHNLPYVVLSPAQQPVFFRNILRVFLNPMFFPREQRRNCKKYLYGLF